jgi:transcriptional regulator
MYVPKIFVATKAEDVESYIVNHPFATLVSYSMDAGIHGTHIPLEISSRDGNKFLIGHLAKANGQKLNFDGQQEMMAIFMESHAYISSSWYEKINVPTWNYIAVHVYGRARVIEGVELYDSINKMVDRYEKGRESRFHLENFEEQELQAHLNGLVGFEMTMDRVEASYKLSQNRNDKDHQEIIDQLEKTGDHLSASIAKEMKKNRG